MSDASPVDEPVGGWRDPWPRVFELSATLSTDRWALVGGLMVQAHALAERLRPLFNSGTRSTIRLSAPIASVVAQRSST